jgi:hypothetical protein
LTACDADAVHITGLLLKLISESGFPYARLTRDEEGLALPVHRALKVIPELIQRRSLPTSLIDRIFAGRAARVISSLIRAIN